MTEITRFTDYPLHRREHPDYRQLLLQMRTQLEKLGYCQLPDFLSAKSLQRLQRQYRDLARHCAKQHGREVNCYYSPANENRPPDHPQNTFFTREFGVIRTDMLPDGCLLQQIYDDRNLMIFIRDVLGIPALYQSRDAYQSLTINCMQAGEHLHWHFDCNDFAVTLAIQAPEEGGEFEFVRDIGRTNSEDISRVLADNHSNLPERLIPRQFAVTEGTLVIFKGGESLHRVLPVKGRRVRLVAALQYHSRDGARDDPRMTQRIYGIDPSLHCGSKEKIVGVQ